MGKIIFLFLHNIYSMRASRKSLGTSSPKKQRASTAFVSQQIAEQNDYNM